MTITDAQLHFFQVFGYLHLPGLMRSEMGWISDEFEQVWKNGVRSGYDEKGETRNAIVPFVDSSARLCTLVDHPLLKPALVRVLGEDYNYLSSDGRPYSGDTGWHPDGSWQPHSLYIKVAFYLDPLTRETGALRVIPGSHRLPDQYAKDAREAGWSERAFGVKMADIPAAALETTPGDIVLFNHNTMHASFGGGGRRRMFTMNLGRRAETPEAIADLEKYIGIHLKTWAEQTHGEIMRSTATASRRKHMQQVMDHEGHLPALRQQVVAEAKMNREQAKAKEAAAAAPVAVV
jgi:hypothetical protein